MSTEPDKVKQKARYDAWYAKNRTRLLAKYKARREASPDKMKAQFREWYLRSYLKNVLRAAKRRARDSGVPFTITEADLEVPVRCPVLGLLLEPSVGRVSDTSPSLDRVRPELGYVVGNVRVICHRANRLKSALSLGEALAIYEYMLDHHQAQRIEAK